MAHQPILTKREITVRRAGWPKKNIPVPVVAKLPTLPPLAENLFFFCGAPVTTGAKTWVWMVCTWQGAGMAAT